MRTRVARMSDMTLTIARDKDVLFVVGAEDKVLIPADESERARIFEALTKAMASIAFIDPKDLAPAPEVSTQTPEHHLDLESLPEPELTDNVVVNLFERRSSANSNQPE